MSELKFSEPPTSEVERHQIRMLIRKQFLELKGDAMVTCAECERRIPVRFSFHCFNCGLWFCHACSAIHFQTTAATASFLAGVEFACVNGIGEISREEADAEIAAEVERRWPKRGELREERRCSKCGRMVTDYILMPEGTEEHWNADTREWCGPVSIAGEGGEPS